MCTDEIQMPHNDFGKKKILFDLLSAQPVGNSKFHGGGEYIKTVFQYLVENYNSDISISAFFDHNAFLDDYLLKTIREKNVVVHDIKQVEELEEHFSAYTYDIFYSGLPYFGGRINFPDNMICVGTFHGFRPLEVHADDSVSYYNYAVTLKSRLKFALRCLLLWPVRFFFYPAVLRRRKKKELQEFERARNMYESALKKFDKIICDSKHTRYALMNFFPDFCRAEVRVYYAPEKYSARENSRMYQDEVEAYGKYILLIGLNRWEKNGFRGLQAIEGLFDKNLLPEYKIVTVGEIPPRVKDIIRYPDRHICYGYVKPELLEELYRNCDIFFYPTMNEGFGLPPLEAMKYGRTCVVSGVCSLPELCGDAVYYINPYDINEMQNRLLNAAMEKKDPVKVYERQKLIFNKQKKDLQSTCEYILGYN